MTLQEKAFAYVDEHFDEMLDELKSACACPSTASSDEGREAMRLRLMDDLRRSGMEPVRHEVEEGNALISASLSGDCPDTILFYNHYDVVEPGSADNWTNKAPFAADVRDGKLYARGVSDDKGGLYFRIHAVRAMLAAGSLPVSVKFLVEGDEESSSYSMKHFSEAHRDEFKELTKADICLWENGRVDPSGHPWIRCGVRGSVAFDLNVTKAATDVHGRYGSSVPSASFRMAWALASLKDPVTERVLIEGFYDDVLPTTEADLKVLHDFPFDEESFRSKLKLESFVGGATGDELKQKMYLEPTLSICAMEAGEPHNGVRGIVPHTASARLSCYLVADQDTDDIERKLKAHLHKHGFDDIVVRRRSGSAKAIRTRPDHPFVARACEAAKEVYAKPMLTELTQLGAGPAAELRAVWPDLPIFGIGPANICGNHHAPDENMGIEDYKNSIKYLIALCYSYRK